MTAKKDSDFSASGAIVATDQVAIVRAGGNLLALFSAIKTFVLKNTVTAVSSSAGVLNIDLSLGDYFTVALTENITSITFSNLPGSGFGRAIFIRVTQDSTPRTVAWPASFRWDGTAPAVSTASGAVDLLSLVSLDNGTKWDATLSKGRA